MILLDIQFRNALILIKIYIMIEQLWNKEVVVEV